MNISEEQLFEQLRRAEEQAVNIDALRDRMRRTLSGFWKGIGDYRAGLAREFEQTANDAERLNMPHIAEEMRKGRASALELAAQAFDKAIHYQRRTAG